MLFGCYCFSYVGLVLQPHRTETGMVASDGDVDVDSSGIDTDVDGFGYKLRESSSSPSPSTPKLKSLSVTSRRFGYGFTTLNHFRQQSSTRREEEFRVASDSLVAIRIRVKRVVQGDRGLENTLILAWVSLSNEDLNRCGTRLRLRDTRIFILGVELDGRLILGVAPIPVTLAHLQLVNRLSLSSAQPGNN